MSDKARDVIADWLCDAARKNGFEHEHGKSTNDYADAILAALAEAGLEIISTAERTALQQFVVKIARGSE